MNEQKRPAAEPEVLNPRYAGATFGDVARALAKPTNESDENGGDGEESDPAA